MTVANFTTTQVDTQRPVRERLKPLFEWNIDKSNVNTKGERMLVEGNVICGTINVECTFYHLCAHHPLIL